LFAPKIANFAFRAEKRRSGKLAQTQQPEDHGLEHPMAAVWKRGNYWRVEIRRLGQPTQNRTFDTKANAEIWARQVEAKMDRGEFVDLKEAERNTLGDLLLRYSEEISPQKKGGDLEILRIRKLRAEPIARIKISELRRVHMADYRDRRLAGDLKTKPVSGAGRRYGSPAGRTRHCCAMREPSCRPIGH
jgi:hypothetical protein